MPLTREELAHLSSLARLTLSDEEMDRLTGELSGILAHMELLSRVSVQDIQVEGEPAAPLRDDVVDSVSLARPIVEFAPLTRDGFFLVPRLGTHSAQGGEQE